MKRWKWAAYAVSVLLLALSPALGQPEEAAETEKTEKIEEAAKPEKRQQKASAGKRQPGLRGDYAIMAKELKLTAEQQEAIKNHPANAQIAENEAKMRQLRTQVQEARKAGEKEKADQLNEEMGKLRSENNKLSRQRREAILAMLTAEQKEAWATFQLYARVVGAYKAAKLTDSQKAKIKELCAPVAKALSQAPAEKGKKKGSGKAQAEAQAGLHKKIQTEILTPEQKQAWQLAEIYGEVTGPLRRAKITKDQQKQIQALCPGWMKQLGEAKDKAARAKVLEEAREKIKAEILTAEQRQNLTPAQPERAKGKKPAKAPKAGKGEQPEAPEAAE